MVPHGWIDTFLRSVCCNVEVAQVKGSRSSTKVVLLVVFRVHPRSQENKHGWPVEPGVDPIEIRGRRGDATYYLHNRCIIEYDKTKNVKIYKIILRSNSINSNDKYIPCWRHHAYETLYVALLSHYYCAYIYDVLYYTLYCTSYLRTTYYSSIVCGLMMLYLVQHTMIRVLYEQVWDTIRFVGSRHSIVAAPRFLNNGAATAATKTVVLLLLPTE